MYFALTIHDQYSHSTVNLFHPTSPTWPIHVQHKHLLRSHKRLPPKIRLHILLTMTRYTRRSLQHMTERKMIRRIARSGVQSHFTAVFGVDILGWEFPGCCLSEVYEGDDVVCGQ